MISVFISYPGEPKKWEEYAMRLNNYLNTEKHINAVLSPKREGVLEDISDRVVENIQNSLYFIVIYPSVAKESVFVNQELGYAYSLYKQKSIEIIPLWQDRKDFKGFVTRASKHLDNSFDMKLAEERVFSNIRKRLLRDDMYPIEIINWKIDVKQPKEERIEFEMELIVDIRQQRYFDDCSIEFVGPQQFNLSSKRDENPFIEYEHPAYDHLPRMFEEFFNVDSDSLKITRWTFDFKKLKGIQSYTTKWTFYERGSELTSLRIGVYLNTVKFGPKFYKVLIKRGVHDDWVIDINPLSMSEKGTIPIERNF